MAVSKRRDSAKLLVLFLWSAVLATGLSAKSTSPPLPYAAPAALTYSYRSSARISRGISAELTAEVRCVYICTNNTAQVYAKIFLFGLLC